MVPIALTPTLTEGHSLTEAAELPVALTQLTSTGQAPIVSSSLFRGFRRGLSCALGQASHRVDPRSTT